MFHRHSFRLVQPKCPLCGSDNVYVQRSLKNYLVLSIDMILGIFLYPLFSYKLKCKKCNHEYQVMVENR